MGIITQDDDAVCMLRCQNEKKLVLQVQWERVWGILAMPCDQQAGLGHQAHRAQGSERLINIIIEDGAEFCMRRCQHESLLGLQVRLERVWGILQSPVTSKLDWVIKYTGPQGSGLFEPVLQAYEQAAAAVLERER